MANNQPQVEYIKCNLESLDPRDRHVIEVYVGFFLYHQLNRFLSKRDTIESYHETLPTTYSYYFYHYITGSNNRQMNLPFLYTARELPVVLAHWNDLEWFQHIQYQFMMELFRIIKHCPLQVSSSIVYRGVNRHYLKEDTTKSYHITTFLSTSPYAEVALNFGNGHIYQITIMPNIACLYYGGDEEELIINPYVCYTFIKKENKGDYMLYHYLLFASDIEPPSDFQSFMEFRNSIALQSEPVVGGSDIESIQHKTRRNNTKNNSRYPKSRHNTTKRKSFGHTTKNIKRTNVSSKIPPEVATIQFYGRITAPIGTSTKGVPLSREIKEIVKTLRNTE